MYCIIVNPNAGKGKGKKNLKTVLKLFSERGAEYSVFETTRAGEAKEFSERLTSSGEQEIIVVGGDGTLHEVLNGLSDPSSCRLGLIPSGTGNDFSAAAGLPSNAAQAAEIILSGETKETDFLCVGGVRCMNVGGLGMDVDVLVRCKKGRFVKGKIKYLLSLLQSLFTFKGYEIEIESGERRETHKALIAVACNGTQIGGGIRICPASVIDDGKIDVMAVECMGKAQIVKAFLYLMKGKVLDYPAAEHFLCERVKIVPSQPCTVQLDGELYDGLEFDARIECGLKMYR
jgi:lipid kinase, YegS/Rv2252/BmrU family